MTSPPSPHSELKGVISFLSHPQRQGKEASTPARKKEQPLLRSQTNTPLRSCSWEEGSLLTAAHPPTLLLPSWKNCYARSPQAVRCGPLSFTLPHQQPASCPWSKLEEPTLDSEPLRWSGFTLRLTQAPHCESTTPVPFHALCSLP